MSAGTGPELVTLGTNVGPAAARNAGLSRVTTCYVGFVDSDVEVSASDLLELTRHFADPEVVVVEPRVVGLSRSSRPRWFERYDKAASSLTLGSVPARVQPGGTVAWLPSACLVARTDRIDSAFDPDLRVGEDVDFVWRVNDAGGLVRYEPAVTARHDTRSTLRGWLGRKAFYGSGSAVLALRHGERLAPAVLSPAYALAAAALLMRLRWSPVLAGLAVASSTRSVRRALPDCEGRTAVASRIALRGFGWSVRQEAALLLRHWCRSRPAGPWFRPTSGERSSRPCSWMPYSQRRISRLLHRAGCPRRRFSPVVASMTWRTAPGCGGAQSGSGPAGHSCHGGRDAPEPRLRRRRPRISRAPPRAARTRRRPPCARRTPAS